MEEEDGLDDLLQAVNQVVVAANVRDLMREDRPQLIRRHRAEHRGWDEHDRREPADDQGHVSDARLHESHGASDAHLPADRLGAGLQLGVDGGHVVALKLARVEKKVPQPFSEEEFEQPGCRCRSREGPSPIAKARIVRDCGAAGIVPKVPLSMELWVPSGRSCTIGCFAYAVAEAGREG